MIVIKNGNEQQVVSPTTFLLALLKTMPYDMQQAVLLNAWNLQKQIPTPLVEMKRIVSPNGG